jgi:hypothetical protein
MDTLLTIAKRPLIPVGEIARELRVSPSTVVTCARRLGIALDRTTTLRKRCTPVQAEMICSDLLKGARHTS